MSTFQTQHFLFLSKLESKNLEKESKKKRGKRIPILHGKWIEFV